MPLNNNNNNQKGPSAAVRLVKLPLVRSACDKLRGFYADAKRRHPNLRAVCAVLEDGAAALGAAARDRASPVVEKLEPQISTANDVACKSLDWLEITFPVLHTPTEQIAASARDKMHEIQEVVSVTVNGTVACVQHKVTWAMERMRQSDEGTRQTLMERAISVATMGLDCALSMSEAVIDQVLPPTEQDKKEAAGLVKGFEASTLKSYPVRLVSLSAKLCQRTYYKAGAMMHSVQVMEMLAKPSALVRDLQATWQTWTRSLQGVPQYLQHQAVTVLFFISQMYNLQCQRPRQDPPGQVRVQLNATQNSYPHKDVAQVQRQATPACRGRRPSKMPLPDKGCNVKGCVCR